MEKMTNCKSCGAEIASSAKTCPKCGAKIKKPFYKTIWFWAIVVILIIAIAGSGGNDDNSTKSDKTVSSDTSVQESTTVDTTDEESSSDEVIAEEPVEEEKVSKEFQNAYKKADAYYSQMHMSKDAIYDQLTSEYGEGFSEDAAQYAVDKLDETADWNEAALKKAIEYQDTMAMSKSSIYDQLISEYGERFTKEQAQYAIDNLPE